MLSDLLPLLLCVATLLVTLSWSSPLIELGSSVPCKDGWSQYGAKCYFLHRMKGRITNVSFRGGTKMCNLTDGADMLSDDSPRVGKFVSKLIRMQHPSGQNTFEVWLKNGAAANANQIEERDKRKLDVTQLGCGNSKKCRHTHHCSVMTIDGKKGIIAKQHHRNCYLSHLVVCEMKAK